MHFYPQYEGNYEEGWRSTSKTPVVVPYHYDANGAGIPIPAAARNVAGPTVAATLATLSQRLSLLAGRVGQLNESSDVQNLQHAYGFYTDRMMWDDVADLFSSDGTAEFGLQGVYVGKASIRRALNQFGETLREGQLNDQAQLETIVAVAPDGHTARAYGIQLGMLSSSGAGQWTESLFDNEYVKEDGVWKIRRLRIYPRLITDYYAGWHKSALRAPGPGKEFPADRASTQHHGIYPEAYFPAIPYAHPTQPTLNSPTNSVPDSRAANAPATLQALTNRIADVERGVAVAEAYDGAENVSNAYGYYIDEFKWVDCADLFAREGWKELSYIGTYVGLDHVRDSMTLRYGSNGRTGKQMTLHQKAQPVVHAAPDGKSARIRERLLQLNSVTDAPGSYIGGIYENEIVLEDGVWKIAGMDLDYTWSATYNTGWAHAQAEESRRYAPAPGAVLPLAPDRPLRGVVLPPFPRIVDVPFHYRNPVSGRTPPVLLLPSELAP